MPKPVRLTETPQEDNTSRKSSYNLSSISTLHDQQVDNQALEEKEFETVNKEDKELLTLNEDVQYHANLSAKVNVQHQTP